MNEAVIMEESYTSEKCNTKSIKYILYLGIKRFFDIIVSLVGCLFLLPITVIVKISYMLNKYFEPVIFKQDRIGKNGKIFKFYKFRSMVKDADEVLFKLLEENEELANEYKENKKLKNDPRITKIGKFLRKTSIDELPQLINILKGDMSLIGNRPYLPREKEDMGLYYNSIVKTKPGLTGYWQVSGRSNVSFEKRCELESFYSEHNCLSLDIKIFFKTFSVVLFGRGAK